MGGFLGIGGSGAKTDRGSELAARQGQWNVFNTGVADNAQSQTAGQDALTGAGTSLNSAEDYFKRLMGAGRADTAQMSAPAINSATSAADANRTAEATAGTGRGGGTAALNRNADTQTQSNIDNIINQNLMSEHSTGAQGEMGVAGARTGIGSTELNNAINNLGIAGQAGNNILTDSTKSYQFTQPRQDASMAGLGSQLGQIITNLRKYAAMFGIGG